MLCFTIKVDYRTLFLASKGERIKVYARGGFEMLLVTDENEIDLTEGIENDFSLNENFSDMEIHVILK